MSTVEMGTWVGIDDESIEYTVFGNEVELDVGGRYSGFEILASEQGLTTLISQCTEALNALRTRHEQETMSRSE